MVAARPAARGAVREAAMVAARAAAMAVATVMAETAQVEALMMKVATLWTVVMTDVVGLVATASAMVMMVVEQVLLIQAVRPA